MNKKRIKVSILVRVMMLIIVAVSLSFLMTSGMVRRIVVSYAARQGGDLAETAATAVKTVVASTGGYDLLLEDEGYREMIHKVCRYLCISCEIQNLYIYTIDENERKHYIVIASCDDEDDRKMNEMYGFGSENTRPLYQVEKNILEGNTEDNTDNYTDGYYEFIDNDYGKVFMYVIPVRDNKGDTYCYIGEDFGVRRITDIIDEDIRLVYSVRILFVSMIFLMLVIFLRRFVIIPIQKLSTEMRNYLKDRNHPGKVRRRRTVFDDEVTEIEESFDKMAEDISGYLGDIEQLTKDRIQNQTQLEIARKIQCGIIPDEYTLSGDGYDIYGYEKPAREVGGDFYDTFMINEDKFCVVVGDISGKGISAALFMVMVKTDLREKLKAGRCLKDTLQEVNQDICLANPENMFATVFASILDVRTGRLSYANAGHNPPLHICGQSSYMKINSGMAMGLFEDIDITEEEIQLQNGEGILIYTDGVTEAVNHDKILFGEERLQSAVSSSFDRNGKDCRASTVVSDVIGAVKHHSEETEQFDDITCVAVFYRKKAEEMRKLSPEIGSFSLISKEILDSLGNSEATRNIIMVCEEMFTNIVNYSGADEVYYSITRTEDTYEVTFSDNGVPFDPVGSELPEKSFDELDTGGMGIMLARLNTREMIYLRENDRNNLTLRFDVA